MIQINLLAIGSRMPDWVKQGYQHYINYLKYDCQINLIEIASIKRTKSANLEKITAQESQLLLNAVPNHTNIIALERTGQMLSSDKLAQQIRNWQLTGINISLLIGGPEGLSAECTHRADFIWSLSALTLPHPLVRIILVEQLYRAFSILKNHPYHR